MLEGVRECPLSGGSSDTVNSNCAFVHSSNTGVIGESHCAIDGHSPWPHPLTCSLFPCWPQCPAFQCGCREEPVGLQRPQTPTGHCGSGGTCRSGWGEGCVHVCECARMCVHMHVWSCVCACVNVCGKGGGEGGGEGNVLKLIYPQIVIMIFSARPLLKNSAGGA